MLAPSGSLAGATLDSAGRTGPRPARKARALRAAALFVAACSLALAPGLVRAVGAAHRTSGVVRSHRAGPTRLDLAQLPLSAESPISAALGADDPSYRMRPTRGGFRATSPAQGLEEHFLRSRVDVRAGNTVVGLGLTSVGFGSSLERLGPGYPRARANTVTYSRPGLSEWYRNGPLGLEQGFTITKAPSNRRVGPLTLSLSLSGGARATLGGGGRSVILRHDGGPSLRYSGLRVSDASGHRLRSWIELRQGRLLVRANTQGARFPVRVDPFIQQGEKLVGTGQSGPLTSRFGYSVALSSDGNTALIGGPGDYGGTGAAWVFTRSGSTWTQQGSKLTGSGELGEGRFGSSVALSANGNTAVIGAPHDNNRVGAAWVFTRSGSTWTQQGPKLTGSGEVSSETSPGEFGESVTLGSSEGNTSLIGGPGDNKGAGAAWVFTRSEGQWTQQGSKLTGGEEITSTGAPGRFGLAVALGSTEGNTAFVGGPGDNKGTGAAWAFTREGGVWKQLGGKLTGSGEVSGETAPGEFGYSVAVGSSEGGTAIVGGPGDNNGAGAAWAFTREGGTWKQQGSKLTGSGELSSEEAPGEFGFCVALSSAEGNTALIGGPGDSRGTGAAWAFTREGGTWKQQGSKLTGSGELSSEEAPGEVGSDVALSSDGSTAIVGGVGDNAETGAAWVFTRSGGIWSQQGSKLTGTGARARSRGSIGASVALSSDGNTALVGGPNDGLGAAWVFTRSGSTWTQQGGKLTGGEEIGEAMIRFGASVALSSDGNTALIGGPGDNSNAGAAWVFTRSEGKWTQQGSKLTGSGASGASHFGASVALSSDGSTALVGGPLDSSAAGAVWVFTRESNKWTQQGSKLTGTGGSAPSGSGSSVALSSDGNTALVGAPEDNGEIGAAWVFTRAANKWTQQGAKLTATGGGGVLPPAFGEAVAVSGDGGTALIGAPLNESGEGAVWAFTRSGSTWTQQGGKITGAGEVGLFSDFGSSIALGAEGNTALVGGKLDNGEAGAAWLFTRSGGTWSEQGEKITASGATGPAQFGSSVALSSAAGTALVGGSNDYGGTGAAWVLVQTPPGVETKSATSVAASSATLNASVNPGGATVSECQFEYGPTTSYGSSVPCTPTPGSGSTPVAVHAEITGLSMNTTYHFRISATNAGGTSKGSDQMFTTPTLKPPVATSESATGVGSGVATLHGSVTPNGGAECVFEYGPTEGYGSTAPCTPSPGSGESPVAVSAAVSGLAGSTTYHFRISASNASGTSHGADKTFTTLANVHYFSNGVRIPAEEPLVVTSWGIVTVRTVAGGSEEVTCHTVQAGTVGNRVAGGSGVGSTQLFIAYDCESSTCPYTSAMTAQSLPWSSVVEPVASAIRSKIAGMRLKVECLKKEGELVSSTTFLGGVQPSVHKGTSALHPSGLEFDASSGSLEAEGSQGGVLARLEGESKIMGYEEQELIAAK